MAWFSGLSLTELWKKFDGKFCSIQTYFHLLKQTSSKMALKNKKTAILLLVCQIIFIILFAVFTEYDTSADARYKANSRDHDKNGTDHDDNPAKHYYPSKSSWNQPWPTCIAVRNILAHLSVNKVYPFGIMYT